MKKLFLLLFLITSSLYAQYTKLTPSLSESLRNGASKSGDTYYLPASGSVINTKYYSVTEGDTVTVEATVTHPNSKQYTHINIYSYHADVVTIGSTQGSLWSTNGANSKCYYSIVVAEGVELLTVEISKSGLSPDTVGVQTISSSSVYSGGLNIPSVSSRASFDGTPYDITQDGAITKNGAPLFIWGIYPDGTRDYSVYQAQGFNAILGNYPGGNALAKAKADGLIEMPNIAPFIIPTNSLYANYANLRTRLQRMVADKDHLIFYWDHEQYSEYDVPKQVISVINDEIPEAPLIVNLGNIGMARLWRSDVDGIMTYGNGDNIAQKFEIINNMDDDGLTVPGSMVVISIFDDAYSAAELRTKVLAAVNAGARGVALFKDGEPSDFPGINGDITTFRIWDSLPALMTEVAELVEKQPATLDIDVSNPFVLGTVDTGNTITDTLRITNTGTLESMRVSVPAPFPTANNELVSSVITDSILTPGKFIDVIIRGRAKTIAGTYNGTLSITHTASGQANPYVQNLSYIVGGDPVTLVATGDTAITFREQVGNELLEIPSFTIWSCGLPVGWSNNGTQSLPLIGIQHLATMTHGP